MSIIRHNQANYNDAISFYQKALKIYGEHYPSFDQDIVLYLSNIGTSLPIVENMMKHVNIKSEY